MICPFCGKNTAEAVHMDFTSIRSGRRVKDGYRVVCVNKSCDARGPKRSSKKLAVKAWRRVAQAPPKQPRPPPPTIGYCRLLQRVSDEAERMRTNDPDFIGFRQTNVCKARNCVVEQMRQLKKSGKLRRDRHGEPLLEQKDVAEAFENAVKPFFDRMKRRLANTGSADDNGHADNCLKALQNMREAAWPEIEEPNT